MTSRNKRLKGYVTEILKENGPMTSHQIMDALYERRVKRSSPKSLPGINSLAMVLRKHKEFISTGTVQQKLNSCNYTVQLWYLKGDGQ